MVVRRAYGATDAKVTSSSLAASLSFLAEAGPTTKSQPPFSWSRCLLKEYSKVNFFCGLFRSSFSNSTPDFAPVDMFNFKAESVRWAGLGANDQSGTGASATRPTISPPEGMNSGHVCGKRSLAVISCTLWFFFLSISQF